MSTSRSSLSVLLVLLSATVLWADGSTAWPEPFRGSDDWIRCDAMAFVDGLASDDSFERAMSVVKLRKLRLQSASALLMRRNDENPATRKQVKSLLRELYRFPVDWLRLEGATLEEACQRLSHVSGVTILAEGQAKKPIDLKLSNSTFWDAVLEICRAGDVGIAPTQSPKKGVWRRAPHRWTWLPGIISRRHPVVLGPSFPRPRGAKVSGPFLLQCSVHEVPGRRELELRLEMRAVPDLPIRAMSEPMLTSGRDWEN